MKSQVFTSRWEGLHRKAEPSLKPLSNHYNIPMGWPTAAHIRQTHSNPQPTFLVRISGQWFGTSASSTLRWGYAEIKGHRKVDFSQLVYFYRCNQRKETRAPTLYVGTDEKELLHCNSLKTLECIILNSLMCYVVHKPNF